MLTVRNSTDCRPAASQLPDGTKLLSLEIGRFVAAFMVILHHLVPAIGDYGVPGAARGLFGLRFPGSMGVQFFFVLSGFVMVVAHAGLRKDMRFVLTFWWRRACRIYPLYWLALLVPIWYLYGLLTPDFARQLFTLDPWSNRDLIPPAWTLRFEVMFYFLFGLAFIPGLGPILMCAWVGAVVLRWLPYGVQALLHVRHVFALPVARGSWADPLTAFYCLYFFAGVIAGNVFIRQWLSRSVALCLATGAILLLLLTAPAIDWGDAYGSPWCMVWVGAVLGMLMVGLGGLERCGALRLGGWAHRLGSLSYPLYIIHSPLMLVFAIEAPVHNLDPAGMLGLFFAELGCILAAGLLLARWFDQPVQRALRTRWPAPRPSANGPTTASSVATGPERR